MGQFKRSFSHSDPTWFVKFAETLKTRHDARLLTKQLEKYCPNVAKVLIHERDVYMINSLRNCKQKTIVGVVGLGHLDGMEKYWNKLKMRKEELNLQNEDLDRP